MKKTKAYIEITIGCIFVAIAYYFFLRPADLVIGGAMGLSIVLQKYINSTLFIYIFNIGSLILGLTILGKVFFLKTCYGTVLVPFIITLLEMFKISENLIIKGISNSNYLLIVSIGAILLTGIGLGIVVRNGATTGGMDVPQKILSKFLKLPFSSVMYLTDGIVIFFGIFAFGIEKGFFAIVTMLTVGYLIDRMCVGGVSRRVAYIITKNPADVTKAIYEEIDRGVTQIEVKGCYYNENQTMLICVMGKTQYYRLKNIIITIDEQAFVFITKTNEVFGKGFEIV